MAMNFPLSPVVGQLFPSPPVAGQPVYQWDGEKWTVLTGGTSPVYIGDVPPGNPPNGALWWNSSNGQLYIYYVDGSSAQWVMIISAQSPQGLPTPNRFVNPAMMVSQEWPLTVVPASGHYPVDGIIYSHSTGGSFNCQQIASPTPGGSPNRIRITTAIADASLAANEVGYFSQRIEGLRVADLMFGSSSAKALMLRFGVRLPAGTYGVAVWNGPVSNRRYIAEYTIAPGEANTDQVRYIPIPPDIIGTWGKDTATGMYVFWTFAAGANFQGVAGSWGPLVNSEIATAN